jgi:hypothetical protein
MSLYSAPFNGGGMEAHGGYLCRLEDFDSELLVGAARRALALDGPGDEADAALSLTVMADRKVVRLAFDAPFTYGRSGARWYEKHHALARLLSRELSTTVHAYVLDPDEMELVASYGGGRKVGGERLFYEDFDPGDVDIDDEDQFEKIKLRWPLGHLAHVFGLTRKDLLAMPRAKSALLNIDGSSPRLAWADLVEPAVRATG